MMKKAKSIIMISLVLLICCSYSLGQSPIRNGVSGLVSNVVPGTYGISSNGAGIFPIGETINGIVNLGEIRPNINITLNEFICNSMSACGTYPFGKVNNCDGAIAYIGGVKSGATVPVAKL